MLQEKELIFSTNFVLDESRAIPARIFGGDVMQLFPDMRISQCWTTPESDYFANSLGKLIRFFLILRPV